MSIGAGSLYLAAAAATSRTPFGSFTPSRGPAAVRMFSSVMLRGIAKAPVRAAPACASIGAVDASVAAVAETTPAAVDFKNVRRFECMSSPWQF